MKTSEKVRKYLSLGDRVEIYYFPKRVFSADELHEPIERELGYYRGYNDTTISFFRHWISTNLKAICDKRGCLKTVPLRHIKKIIILNKQRTLLNREDKRK
jgi:hypothetical protein